MAALERGYKNNWLVSACEASDTNRIIHLLELGIRPADDALVDNAVTAGNWMMAALLRKYGAPINAQVADFLTLMQKLWRGPAHADATKKMVAIWEYIRKPSDILVVRGIRARAVFQHWVRTLLIVLYWQRATNVPGSKAYHRAAKRFKDAANDA